MPSAPGRAFSSASAAAAAGLLVCLLLCPPCEAEAEAKAEVTSKAGAGAGAHGRGKRHGGRRRRGGAGRLSDRRAGPHRQRLNLTEGRHTLERLDTAYTVEVAVLSFLAYLETPACFADGRRNHQGRWSEFAPYCHGGGKPTPHGYARYRKYLEDQGIVTYCICGPTFPSEQRSELEQVFTNQLVNWRLDVQGSTLFLTYRGSHDPADVLIDLAPGKRAFGFGFGMSGTASMLDALWNGRPDESVLGRVIGEIVFLQATWLGLSTRFDAVVVGGHSLGGAYAMLTAMILSVPDALIQPYVGVLIERDYGGYRLKNDSRHARLWAVERASSLLELSALARAVVRTDANGPRIYARTFGAPVTGRLDIHESPTLSGLGALFESNSREEKARRRWHENFKIRAHNYVYRNDPVPRLGSSLWLTEMLFPMAYSYIERMKFWRKLFVKKVLQHFEQRITSYIHMNHETLTNFSPVGKYIFLWDWEDYDEHRVGKRLYIPGESPQPELHLNALPFKPIIPFDHHRMFEYIDRLNSTIINMAHNDVVASQEPPSYRFLMPKQFQKKVGLVEVSFQQPRQIQFVSAGYKGHLLLKISIPGRWFPLSQRGSFSGYINHCKSQTNLIHPQRFRRSLVHHFSSAENGSIAQNIEYVRENDVVQIVIRAPRKWRMRCPMSSERVVKVRVTLEAQLYVLHD